MDAQTLANAMDCNLNVATANVADFNTALIQAECTTVVRAAMFCAQVGHESVGLRFMEEIWGPTAAQLGYEGRADLGNTQPGDGKLFKGRGPIQLTGRANYGRFGAWAKANKLVDDKNHFVNDPALVATSQWGFLAASWYWTVARDINPLADARDILGATKAVNGGTNGLTDRTDRWNRCLALGNALLPTGDGGDATASNHTPLVVLED